MSSRSAVIALGSNIADRLAHLQAARAGLEASQGVSVVGSSRVFATAPVGGPAQDDFLNACLAVETTLSARELLGVCQGLEEQAHRKRLERWGPRTLDVDIVDIEGCVCNDPELTVPHPRAWERAFVLVPWLDVDPEASLVVAGTVRQVSTLARAADDFATVVVADQQWPDAPPWR